MIFFLFAITLLSAVSFLTDKSAVLTLNTTIYVHGSKLMVMSLVWKGRSVCTGKVKLRWLDARESAAVLSSGLT